ncbi:CobW family GTP-binding protein [Edaphobacillus lindanitolerans]|nr:GTP-binding protein [Edaphobacillus lindanitolerans]
MTEVYIFSGFLGSGKTSLLTHAIRQAKEEGLKPGVIMNELGQLAFDSAAVDGDVPLREILDGCICCTGAEKTEAQVQTLLHEGVDIIFIETTGAAHPVEALDSIHSPLFGDALDIRGIVTIADGRRWLGRESMSPQVRMLFLEQIRHASVILLNKTDLMTDAERSKAVSELQAINQGALLLETVNGKAPLGYLRKMSVPRSRGPVQQTAIGKQLPISSRLVSIDEPVEREAFEAWVKSLPDSIYRMKGYVKLEGHRYPTLFQYAYGMVQWIPESMNMPCNLVIIGENPGAVTVPGNTDV